MQVCGVFSMDRAGVIFKEHPRGSWICHHACLGFGTVRLTRSQCNGN